MTQAVIAYGLVALAVAWVAWSMVLPRAVKLRAKALARRRPRRMEPAPEAQTGPGSTPPPD